MCTLNLAAVVHADRHERQRRQESRDHQNSKDRDVDETSFRHVRTCLHGLEANVLKRVGGLPIEARRYSVVAPLGCEGALRNPRRGSMTRRRKLVVRTLTCAEGLLRFVETVLLEQSTSEHELRIADLADLVDAVAQQLERVAGLLLRTGDVTRAEVNLGDAVDRMRGLRVVSDL